MCHPVLWKLQVRTTPVGNTSQGSEQPPVTALISLQSQGPGLPPIPLPSAQLFSPCPSLPSSPSSFCQKHSPEQAAEATPEQNTNCIICMEPVEDNKSYSTLVCPACKHAWFHRACIQVGALPYTSGQAAAGNPQHLSLLPLPLMTVFLLQGQAIRAGIDCFQCPLCRDADAFLSDMLIMGIRIPLRLVFFCRLLRIKGTSAAPAQGRLRQAGPFAARDPRLPSASRGSWKWAWSGRAGLLCSSLSPGAAGAHCIFSFLWQWTNVGGRQCIRIAGSETRAL